MIAIGNKRSKMPEALGNILHHPPGRQRPVDNYLGLEWNPCYNSTCLHCGRRCADCFTFKPRERGEIHRPPSFTHEEIEKQRGHPASPHGVVRTVGGEARVWRRALGLQGLAPRCPSEMKTHRRCTFCVVQAFLRPLPELTEGLEQMASPCAAFLRDVSFPGASLRWVCAEGLPSVLNPPCPVPAPGPSILPLASWCVRSPTWPCRGHTWLQASDSSVDRAKWALLGTVTLKTCSPLEILVEGCPIPRRNFSPGLRLEQGPTRPSLRLLRPAAAI